MTRLSSTLHRKVWSSLWLGLAFIASFALGTGEASAYVGDSFMKVQGVKGDAPNKTHENWVRFNANYWEVAGMARFSRRRDRNFFSGPQAPRQGEGALVVSIDKRSPVLSKLMAMCAAKTTILEMTYAKSSERARPSQEAGPRPADIPEFWEYKLSDVTLSKCPVVEGAPDQAFVVSFKNIQWLNYTSTEPGVALTLTPAALPVRATTGETKHYVLSWYGYAHDIADDQCSVMTDKHTEDVYYRYFTPEEAAKEKVRLAPRGGPTFDNGQMCLRGPEQLNVCRLPGIVPDPVQPEPNTKIARGLNLDGHDGVGPPPPGIRKHRNFVSPDGLSGIDNQLYVVEGCMRGLRGRLGQMVQYANEQRKNGQLAIMLQVDGIDSLQNDDSIDLTLLYSLDPTAKSGDGARVLADYTFRITDNTTFSHTFKRWHGRIVDGVLITDPSEPLNLALPLDFKTTLVNPAMRLKFMPDGTLKGVMAGYQDWRAIVTANGHSLQESLFGSSTEAMYNSLRRNADALWNPVTREYDGISSAWDIDGVPAFVSSGPGKSQIAQSTGGPRAEAQTAPRPSNP